jgi:AcrR family transcriptional regulator
MYAETASDDASASQIADRCGVHRSTAFRWKRRLKREQANSSAAPKRALEGIENPEMSEVRDARVLRSRLAIRKALLSLIKERRYDQVTIRDISDKAGIGYATFFRHYASKEALLSEIATEQIARLSMAVLPLVEGANPGNAALQLCRYVDEQRAQWEALLSGGAVNVLREEFVRLAQKHAQVRISDLWPIKLGATLGVSATTEILGWWMSEPEKHTPEEVAEILNRLVVQPLLAGSIAVESAGAANK